MLVAFLDGSIFGSTHGGGTPQVLALHGWRRTNADFDAVLGSRAGDLSDPFGGEAVPAIALDLPGFGASPPPPVPWGTAAYAQAVARVLEALPEPVVVLGHSFGGRVAIRLAAQSPGRVRGLVLSGVPFGGGGARPAPKLGYRLWRGAHRLGVVGEARMEAARQRYGSRDYREATGVMREVLVAALADDYLPLLAEIRQPTRLVWGARDTAAPLAGASLALEQLASGRLEVLEGVGHLVPDEAPGALRRALSELLA